MAFPTTPVLDNLLRAGLGGNWSGPIFDPTIVVDTASGARASGAAAFSDAYWNQASYGPDVEAYITVATLPSGASDEIVMLIARYDTATISGYSLEVDRAANWKLLRIDSNVQTLLLQDNGVTTPTVAAGDSIGFAVIGSNLTAWHKPAAGAWTSYITYSDVSYVLAGRVGFEAFSNVELLTNFGGGTVARAAIPFVPRRMPMGV